MLTRPIEGRDSFFGLGATRVIRPRFGVDATGDLSRLRRMDDQSHIVAAEAAVTAALEPPRRRFFSKRRKAQPPPLPYCENCKAVMAGPFCAQCGQHAVDYRRSFGRVFLDVLVLFVIWDSKLFNSIGLHLVWPCRLTFD